MEEPPPASTVAHSFRGPSRSRSPGLHLPAPFAPSSTLEIYKSRLASAFSGASPRVCIAFWLFGLINNVLYVIILSAALDLVGPTLPKSIVLLADVLPSFITKLTAPYFVHALPYRLRVILLVLLSFLGMQLVAWADALPARLFGVVLASVSSGLGELSFLALTHFYGHFSIAFWGSGTGAAGLVGAAMYMVATTWIGASVRGSLMAFGFLPIVMLVAFFAVLPMGPLKGTAGGYEPIDAAEEAVDEEAVVEGAGLLGGVGATRTFGKQETDSIATFRGKLMRTKRLFLPYVLPLLLVYIAEYTINLGVSPTLLFPLSSTPFTHYRDFYPFYNTLYQAGVFVSRSSTPFVRIPYLYTCSLLQCVNLALLILQALFNFVPSVYLVFLVVFWEGLLGGAVYVNTFAEIMEKMQGREREFSLGVVTVGDSAGIAIAGFIGLWLEGALCRFQVGRGREYCRMS